MKRKQARPPRTTSITVTGERWDVPRGFGELYRRVAREQLAALGRGRPGVVIDGILSIMRLVGYDASITTVAAWPLRKRIEVEIYCATVHARAGDNPVPRHPKPSWLPDPWKGRWAGDGAFAGPTPTVIP